MKEKRLRKAPKQARSEFTVQMILKAGCEALERLGAERFYQFQTGSVAEAAGVSIGTLYQYFPNKESLLAEIFDYCYRIDLKIAEEVIRENFNKKASEVLRLGILRILKDRYQKFPNMHRAFAKHFSSIVRFETNAELEEKVAAVVQQLLELKSKGRGESIRYQAFLISRGFIDVIRSTLIYRPEYVHDSRFHETFANFLTASIK